MWLFLDGSFCSLAVEFMSELFKQIGIRMRFFFFPVDYALKTECCMKPLKQELHLKSLSPLCVYSLLYINLKILKITSLTYSVPQPPNFNQQSGQLTPWCSNKKLWWTHFICGFLSGRKFAWFSVLRPTLCNKMSICLSFFVINQVLLQILFVYSLFMP